MALTPIQYFNGWRPTEGEPFVDWTEEQAKAVHEGRGKYGVLLPAPKLSEPDFVVVEIQVSSQSRFMTCHFLGNSKRNYATFYIDDQNDREILFLNSAMYYHPKQAPLPDRGFHNHEWRLRHLFELDGTARTAYFREGPGARNQWADWRFSPDDNYFEIPNFGQYDSIVESLLQLDWTLEDDHGARQTGHNKSA